MAELNSTHHHRFAETFRQVRADVVKSMLFSSSINLLMLATPLYMLQIYDRVLSSRSTDTLLLLTVIVVVALFTMVALEKIRTDIMQRIGAWLENRLSSALIYSGIYHTLNSDHESGAQGLRDLSNIRGFVASPSILSITDSPWVPIYIGVIFLLHPVLGWIAVIGTILILVLAVFNARLTNDQAKQSADASIAAFAHVGAAFRNSDVVQAMGMAPKIIEQWLLNNGKAQAKQLEVGNLSGYLSSAAKFSRHMLQVAMLGIGAYLVLAGEMTAGGIIAGSILMVRAIQPVEQSISAWRAAASAHNAYLRLDDQLATVPDYSGMALPKPAGVISIENLVFGFPGTKEPLIKGLNLRLGAGEQLAIIGPSGSGKSTLARLMLGVLKPSSGHARLDGMDIYEWDPEDRGQYVGYLPQDVELFPGTIKENIARLGDVDAEQVIAAAQMAGVHEMIVRLPKGYDTHLGESGYGLSGGERQRVGLARALFGNPSLVVLDEPSSSLDQAGEVELASAMENLKQANVTTIIITHRPATLDHVDKVMVLQDGMVRAFGTRDEVIKDTESTKPASSTVTKKVVSKVVKREDKNDD